jgi:hypothetical protein
MNKSAVGLYGSCVENYLFCEQIELKSDSTFEYYIFMDVGGGRVIKGNWKRAGKESIILNSFEQPINSTTTYSGRVDEKRNRSVKITIRNANSPLIMAYVIINNRLPGKVTDLNGVVEFEIEEVNSITYEFIGRSETIEIEEPNYNEIDIVVRDLEYTAIPKFITNEVIHQKRGKLIFQDNRFLKKANKKNRRWE